MKNYVHPNFKPSNLDAYLEVVTRLRTLAQDTNADIVEVSQNEYDILEDASHPTMKGKGHTVYGKKVVVI